MSRPPTRTRQMTDDPRPTLTYLAKEYGAVSWYEIGCVWDIEYLVPRVYTCSLVPLGDTIVTRIAFLSFRIEKMTSKTKIKPAIPLLTFLWSPVFKDLSNDDELILIFEITWHKSSSATDRPWPKFWWKNIFSTILTVCPSPRKIYAM